MNTNTLIIIPAYNCQDQLGQLLKIIKKKYPEINICVINDGSSDKTLSAAKKYSVAVIDNKKNMGKGKSLHKGLLYAKEKGFNFVITMDADMQHAPDDLEKFFISKADIAVGARDISYKKMPLLRIFSNTISSLIISFLCKQQIKDSQCGYRKIKLNRIDDFNFKSSHYQFETELLLHILKIQKGSIENIPVKTIYGKEKSHIRHFKDTMEFIKIIWRYIWISK